MTTYRSLKYFHSTNKVPLVWAERGTSGAAKPKVAEVEVFNPEFGKFIRLRISQTQPTSRRNL